MSRRPLFLAGLLTTLAACAPAAPTVDVAAETAAIKALGADFATKANAGDWAGVAAFYATDALLMPPNAKAVSGTAAIQQYWSATPAGTKVELTVSSVTLSTAGELATDAGTYKLTIPMPDGSSVTDEGKYLVTWKKGTDGWKMAQDIWNSDLPPVPPAPAAPAK